MITAILSFLLVISYSSLESQAIKYINELCRNEQQNHTQTPNWILSWCMNINSTTPRTCLRKWSNALQIEVNGFIAILSSESEEKIIKSISKICKYAIARKPSFNFFNLNVHKINWSNNFIPINLVRLNGCARYTVYHNDVPFIRFAYIAVSIITLRTLWNLFSTAFSIFYLSFVTMRRGDRG